MTPEYDEGKFKQVVHLAASLIADHQSAGAVKLNKVIYFAEFGHYRETGSAISGTEFIHRRMGPTPYRLLPVRQRLIDEGYLSLDVREIADGVTEHRLSVTKPMDYSLLDSEEIARIESVAEELRSLSANAVSDLSHLDGGWRTTVDGETIPYDCAFMDTKQVLTDSARERMISAEARYL